MPSYACKEALSKICLAKLVASNHRASCIFVEHYAHSLGEGCECRRSSLSCKFSSLVTVNMVFFQSKVCKRKNYTVEADIQRAKQGLRAAEGTGDEKDEILETAGSAADSWTCRALLATLTLDLDSKKVQRVALFAVH